MEISKKFQKKVFRDAYNTTRAWILTPRSRKIFSQ